MVIIPFILFTILLNLALTADPSYRILRQIGMGAFSTVHLAERCFPDRCDEVAIKIIPHPPIRNTLEEVDILMSLDHPNILYCIDHFTAGPGETLYIVTELINGVHLNKHVQRNPSKLIELLRSLIETVAHLHTRRIIHGDLQSSNIMVTKEGVLKIIDFGCSNVINYDREEFFKSRVAHDIMELGVIFYEFEPYLRDELLSQNIIRSYKHLTKFLRSHYQRVDAHDILQHPLFLLVK